MSVLGSGQAQARSPMRRSGRRLTYPWLRSTDESVPRARRANRQVTVIEMLAIIVVVAQIESFLRPVPRR